MKPGTINVQLEAETLEYGQRLAYRIRQLEALAEKLHALKHGHNFGDDGICKCGTTNIQYHANPELCPLARWEYRETLTSVWFRLEKPATRFRNPTDTTANHEIT